MTLLSRGVSTLVLVHGAASGPWVFDGWPEAFPGVEPRVVDLHRGLDVARASMNDYADAVTRAARGADRPLVLCGWSMGGLVALMAAEAISPDAVVLLEPSPPAEVAGHRPEVRPVTGLFDGEEVYGRFPDGITTRPESMLARAERQRGISVPSLPCPALVVYSDEFADERGRAVAAWYGARELHFSGLDHWDLVLDARVRLSIARVLTSHTP